MDPKDQIISEGWIEKVKNPKDPQSTKENTYGYERRYADGRVVTDYYHRGKSGIAGTPLGSEQDRLVTQGDVFIDPEQEKRFNEELKRTTPTATSQATAQRDTIDRAGHTWQYNTETKTYDIDLGPKDDPETVKRRQAAEDRAQAREDRLASTAEQNTELARSRDERAGRTEERQTAVAERQAASSEDASKRGWAQLALQQQQEQRLSEADAVKLRNGEVVRTSEGRFIQIRNDPSGKAIVEDVTPPDTRPSPNTQLPIGTHLGTIYTGVQSAAQKIADNPNMTPQEKLKALDQLEAAGKLLADETSTILTSQQNTLTNQTSQRNADITDAASRRTFSSNLVDQSFKDVSSLAEYAPAGSGIAGPAFLGRIMLGLSLADKLGGLKTFDRVAPGAAAQQVYDTPLPGSQQQASQVQQQPQQQPSNAPVINIVNGVPSVPQSVQQAIPPNPMAQSLPGGGYLPMDNSLSFDQGQLKAPGYRADEDTPAWAQEMFQ